MKGGPCTTCGAPLEPDARFCVSCGSAVHGAITAPVPSPFPVVPPVYIKPPRNPRQTASYAVAVIVLVCGMFTLVFGNMILYWDAFDTQWDRDADRDMTVINPGALLTGIAYVASFGVALLSAYCALRLLRYQLAVAGPVALLVAYFSALSYQSDVLIVTGHVLILSVVSLALLYYAIPIYAGRNVRDPSVRFSSPRPPR